MCTPFPLVYENNIFDNNGERCVQNMCTPFPLVYENHIFDNNGERCIQNVCTPFPLVHENHIFYNVLFSTPNRSHIVTGMVFTECVYTVPIARGEQCFL